MVLTLDRFGDEAPARRSSRDETSSSLQGRASRLQQRVTVLEVDLAQAQSQINSLKPLRNKADELLSMLMASQGLAAETTGPAFISKNPQLRAFTPVVAAAKPNTGLIKPKHGRRAP